MDSFLAKPLACQPESEGERHRERKGGIVGGDGDALGVFASVLCNHCYCASVTAGGQACQDRAPFPQRPQPLCWNAQEEILPARPAAMDGQTPSPPSLIHVHMYQGKYGAYKCATV